MAGGYRQLQPKERVTLAALRQQSQSPRQIAMVLGRSAGTLSRELRRNAATTGYASSTAQRASAQRRQSARPPDKLHVDGPLWPLVTYMLGWL